MRDLKSIYSKLLQVLYPPKSGGNNELLREWDLWGPLVICLALAIILSLDVSFGTSVIFWPWSNLVETDRVSHILLICDRMHISARWFVLVGGNRNTSYDVHELPHWLTPNSPHQINPFRYFQWSSPSFASDPSS